MRNAINIAMQSISVGAPFVKRDKRAQDTKYLYFTEKYDEIFEEVWKEYEVWITKVVADDSTDVDTVVTPPPLQGAKGSVNKRPAPGAPDTPQKR